MDYISLIQVVEFILYKCHLTFSLISIIESQSVELGSERNNEPESSTTPEPMVASNSAANSISPPKKTIPGKNIGTLSSHGIFSQFVYISNMEQY